MKIYIKRFLHRGLIFGGFGPMIMGIIFFVLSKSLEDFSLSGEQVLLGIVSTYLLAFVHAGASVLNQIEEWPVAKSTFFHFLALYIAYSTCYLINSWIPFEPMVLIIFTASFVFLYFVIWLSVMISLKVMSHRLNEKLR